MTFCLLGVLAQVKPTNLGQCYQLLQHQQKLQGQIMSQLGLENQLLLLLLRGQVT